MSICAALKAHPMHVKCNPPPTVTPLCERGRSGRTATDDQQQRQLEGRAIYRGADECNTPVNPNTSQLFAMHLSYKPTTLSIPLPLLLCELCVTFNGIHDKLLKTTTCSPYSRYFHRDLLLLHAAIRSQRPCKLQRGHTTDKLRITSHLNRFYGCCCTVEKTTTMTNTKGCLGTKRRQGGRRHPNYWMEEEVTRPCRYSLYVEETNSIAGIQSTITNAPCCTRPSTTVQESIQR